MGLVEFMSMGDRRDGSARQIFLFFKPEQACCLPPMRLVRAVNLNNNKKFSFCISIQKCNLLDQFYASTY